MVHAHIGPTPSLKQSHDGDSYPVILTPHFKQLLRREFHALVAEWDHAPVRRRKQIASIAQLIIDILDDGEGWSWPTIR